MQSKKAVIYCRVSTKEQVEEGNSLATQEKICREYAARHCYEIAEVFIEQGESAKTTKRTELQRLFAYCSLKKNMVSVVITYKIDRISRNTDDYSSIRLQLKRYGVEIKSTSEHFENTPAGRFMENMIATVAQFDNDVRTERCIGGMREAVREGRYVWMGPIGYDNVRIGGKANIAPNSMAPLVRMTFEEIAKGCDHLENIRQRMAAKGLVNAKGLPLTKSLFYRMIRNELYAGWINKLGEKHRGIFEPIITEELFEQVQRVLKHGVQKRAVYLVENPDFPLRRFVRHTTGLTLTGGWSQGRRNRYPYYLFRMKGMSFRKDDLDRLFMIFLNGYSLSEKHYKLFLQQVEEQLVQKTKDKWKEAKRTENYIAELKEKQNILIQKNILGIVSDGVLKQQLDFIEHESMRAHAILQAMPGAKLDYGFFADLIKTFLLGPGNVWLTSPFETQRNLQWFNFPQGVLFDGTKYQTKEIRSILKLKEQIPTLQSCLVNYPNPAFDTPQVPEDQYWDKIGLEMQELAGILQGKQTEDVP